MRAIEDLRKLGKVRYLGLSNYAGWQVCRSLWLCDVNAYPASLVTQPMYNLLARGIEQEFVPFCREFAVPMVVYNPLARGLLTGNSPGTVISSPNETHQSSLDRYRHPAYFKAVEELRIVAERSGRSLINLSLNWLLHHTATDCVILGAHNLDQIQQNLGVLEEGPLSDETVATCDLVWQGLRAVTPQYHR